MGRKYRYDWLITEFQAPWRITITSTSGPLPTTLSYRLTDRVTDTEVGFTVSGYPAGAMRLLQPLIARSTQANLDRGFARLQEFLNADQPLVTFGDAHEPEAGLP